MFELQDEKTQKKAIVLCWFAYMLSYLARYSYTANMVSIIDDFNVTKPKAGFIATLLFICYSSGQLLNSFIAKKVNRKLFLAFSLITSGLINLVFFFDVPFWLFYVLWPINGLVQSMTWTPIGYCLILNISKERRTKTAGFMGASTPVGTILCYVVGFLTTKFLQYRFSFLIGGIVCCFMGVLWFILYDKLLPINRLSQEAEQKAKATAKDPTILWSLAICTMMALFIATAKDGLSSWFPSFVYEKYAIDKSYSILLTIGLLIPPFFGSISAPFIYNKLKSVKKFATLGIGCNLILATIIILFKNQLGLVGNLVIFGLLCAVSSCTGNLLISIFPFQHKNRVTLFQGVLDFGNHIGSAISTFVFGAVAASYGWDSIFVVIIIVIAIPFLLSIYLLLIKKLPTE